MNDARMDGLAFGRELVPELPAELTPFLALLDQPCTLPVCRGCEVALLPKSVMDHLRKHHQLPAHLRGLAKALVATLPSLNFDDVPRNPDGSAPVAALRVVDAFQCRQCHFIRRDVTDVRKHINNSHEMSAAGGYRKIQAQSWFAGRRASFWRVRAETTGTAEDEFDQCGGYNLPVPDAAKPGGASNSDAGSTESTINYGRCRFGLFGRGFGAMHPAGTPRGTSYKVPDVYVPSGQ